jgi:hypothetical protein
MALPRQLRASASDLDTRPLIRFDARRALLDAANARAGQKSYRVTAAAGLELQIDVPDVRADMTRDLRAKVNRLLQNAASTLVDRAAEINRRRGYDTGLMSSSWKGKVTGDADSFVINLTNATPYASVAKQAGADWRAGRTIVETYIRPMVRKARKEIEGQLKTLILAAVARSKTGSAR